MGCPSTSPHRVSNAAYTITALDTAYARYVRDVTENDAVRAAVASRGLTGAVGVFGAVASEPRRVVLVRE